MYTYSVHIYEAWSVIVLLENNISRKWAGILDIIIA